MVLAVFFFSLMDSALKSLSTHYPPLQVATLRGLTALPLVFAYLSWRGAWASVWRVRWSLHLLRGVAAVAMLTLFTYGLSGLPLTNAYTVFFVAPLMITALSIPFLKERVPRHHWWAIGIGLLGVVIALRPSGEGLISGHGLAVMAAALCYAGSAIAGRVVGRTDSAESMVWWTTVMLTVGAGALAWPQWRPLETAHATHLGALALSGFLGQLAITEAFRHGQASAVAPFEYTALAWGVALDWLVWHTWPENATWLGGAVVIGSGLYILRRERQHLVSEHP